MSRNPNTTETIERLSTMIGEVMEDASLMAITPNLSDPLELARNLQQLGADINILANAMEVLFRRW